MTEISYNAHGAPATGVVWCPGPLANTVWVLPHSGASSADAVVVKAPMPKRAEWHAVDYRGFAVEGRWSHHSSVAARFAAPLPAKTWKAALGVTDVLQLALTEDVAA